MVLNVCLTLKRESDLRQIEKVQKSYHHTINNLVRDASSHKASSEIELWPAQIAKNIVEEGLSSDF
jgi:hypothetical protein